MTALSKALLNIPKEPADAVFKKAYENQVPERSTAEPFQVLSGGYNEERTELTPEPLRGVTQKIVAPEKSAKRSKQALQTMEIHHTDSAMPVQPKRIPRRELLAQFLPGDSLKF